MYFGTENEKKIVRVTVTTVLVKTEFHTFEGLILKFNFGTDSSKSIIAFFSELCLGTYECVATKDYCRDSKEPNTPGVIFAIDVSYPMVKEGVVQLICANIKSMLSDLPRDPHCDKVCS